jgi:hypothetical protein
MSKKLKPVLALVVTAICFFGFSCTKPEQEENSITKSNSRLSEKFFSYSGTNPEMMAFINEIQKQNEQKNFLKFFVENNGYPIWDKSVIKTSTKGTFAIIPLVLNNVSETNGFIVAKKSGNSLFNFSLYRKDLLDTYGYEKKSSGYEAGTVQATVNYFNRNIFGKQTQTLPNRRLLPEQIRMQYPNHLDEGHLLGKFKSAGNHQTQLNSTSCVFIQESTDWWYDPDGEDDPEHDSGNEYYVYTTTKTSMFCFEDGTGGGGGGNWFDPGLGGGGGGGGPNLVDDVVFLTVAININPAQALWLNEHPDIASQLRNYVEGSTSPANETKQKAIDHINNMMNDNNYLSFVNDQIDTGDPGIIWWEDDDWISDPDNINFDIDHQAPQQSIGITPEEKALILIYPYQAFRISLNVTPAIQITEMKMGTAGTPHENINSKKDAFRHAFFQAINARDCPGSVLPVFLTGSQIVDLFADAHESDVPPQLSLEKTMDMFNNDVGINYCWNCIPFYNTNKSIGNEIKTKLDNGELRYLKPLDLNDPNWEDNFGVNPATATNGITPATQLTPTNQ